MTRVKLPDGRHAVFPDSMSHEDIIDVLQKQFPQQESQQPQQQESEPAFLSNRYLGQHVLQPLKDASSAYTQGVVNTPIGAANLAIKAGNALNRTNAPEIPYADYAPHNTAAAIGNVGSILSGGLGVNALTKGASLLPRIAAQGSFGAATSPEHPVLGAALGSTLEAAGPSIGRGFNSLLEHIPNNLNEVKGLLPSNKSKEIFKFLGNNVNSDVNAESVAKDINEIANKRKADALSHNENVKDVIGNIKINEKPIESLPEGNIPKIAFLYGRNPDDLTILKTKEINSAINKYRKDSDLSGFTSKMEDLFGHNGLNHHKESQLEQMLDIEHELPLKYTSEKNVKNIDKYPDGLSEIHETFIKQPTFAKGHKVVSQLNSEINKLLSKGKGLDTAGFDRVTALKKSRNFLQKDMDVLVKKQPQHIQDEWDLFKKKYREDFKPFESTATLRKITSGEIEGVKPTQLRSIFSHPKKNPIKILNDLSPATKNKLLYNELVSGEPGDAEATLKKLNALEKHGGYSRSFTPELNSLRKDLEKRVKTVNFISAKPLRKLAGKLIGIK